MSGAVPSLVRGLLVLLCWALGGAARAETAPFRVVRGQVTSDGGALQVGQEGARLEFARGLSLELGADTRLISFGATPLWLDTSGKTDVYLFHVDRGHVEATVARTDGEPIPAVFRTPHKFVGGVREGRLGLEVGEVAALANLGGRVFESRRSGWQDLPDGALSIKRSGVQQPLARTLARPPVIAAARRVWSGLAGPTLVGGFEWSEIPRASAYTLRIQKIGVAQTIFEERTARRVARERLVSLPPGDYAVRVSATDEFGFPGVESEPFEFRVLGFVPAGETYLDASGVVRVGSDRAARFSHTEGLEVTYGAVGPWVPAPSELFFRDVAKTVVRFRHPDAPGVVSIPVEQQRVEARIEVGPRAAIWPADDVWVVVRLVDGGDGRAAARIEPRISVQAGVTPLQLNWQRAGVTFRAKVPQQPGEGPWVLRVTVSNAGGLELGRTHLEIVSAGFDELLRSREQARLARERDRSAAVLEALASAREANTATP